MTTRPRPGIVCVAVLLAAAISADILRGQAPKGLLRYGLTAGTIESASANDAVAASLLWAQGIAEQMGGLFSGAEADVYPTPAQAAAAINEGRADVIAMSVLEYLSVEKSMKATPALVWEVSNQVMVDFVLLARANGGARLPDVAGRSLAVLATNRPWALSEVWADVMLADAGVRKGRSAFASVKAVAKKGHAAMAVFFGQADYAIESRTAFETAVELNPQLGKDLVVLTRSPRFVPGLVCLADALGPERQRLYVEHASRLHDRARFTQAFMVMRVTKLAPWNPKYVESVRELVARHHAWQVRR